MLAFTALTLSSLDFVAAEFLVLPLSFYFLQLLCVSLLINLLDFVHVHCRDLESCNLSAAVTEACLCRLDGAKRRTDGINVLILSLIAE